MRAAGLPASRWVVAALGLWEILAGSLALGVGGTLGGSALFVTYAGFAGFIAYALIKLASGRPRQCPLAVYCVAAVFAAKFAFL